MGFRKRKDYCPAAPSPIYETRYTTEMRENKEGIMQQVQVEEKVDITDPTLNVMPSSEEYTLENLLLSGANLQQLPTGNFNPADKADVEAEGEDILNLVKTIVESSKEKTE